MRIVLHGNAHLLIVHGGSQRQSVDPGDLRGADHLGAMFRRSELQRLELSSVLCFLSSYCIVQEDV